MELFYLLFSIFSTFFISFLLTLLLPFRILLHRLLRHKSTLDDESNPVSFYQGIVWHERRRPTHHSFKYLVRYALINLDRIETPPSDHLSADEARSVAGTSGPVFLLTIPPSVGYEQNPLSVYYCYELDGNVTCLKKCIAEVTNTPWGERVTFLFNPKSDTVVKSLHVSPFMDMVGTWHIKTNSPGSDLFISISVHHPELGDYFIATLNAKKITSCLIDDATLFFWLMPHKVAVWIYWHALQLWWKGVKYVQHPRYVDPEYREDVLFRDRKLQSCPALVTTQSNSMNNNGNYRRFKWTDAKWPWS
ncbi:uncharacterized protein LOC124941791 [Impatiens glandulifera]|uniref:uncharacterized protein LOC124941791 n=1 Tax=Impatiens glandulifera TaxID=253017 RepID=UPI001FB15844|nr:uncharacterized protein LOC124941791 [Impatiens glandulifera]